MDDAETATEWERHNTAARASAVSRRSIDVGRYVAEMERLLRHDHERGPCTQALGILQRWQFDEGLDGASRQRARRLVLEFARNEQDEA